ncbi:hypothetical protein LEP1GSC199_0863 [Leptospira vanthielii serovar Holland str. Waz Holland = ATCC 700522]|uniref:Uncharacterized protein n=1 Tax=Leptospira vanthielii serovar Holland str. Waz Holland = ATCC 700522 TaxID=1218591 RepID=N1W4Y3_9LEPT|nr:hypothetical protein LEP1GSC199_0863 [Leptospira vanthielii serovar Holland str. Waz Holland = ATCC 700522]
MQGKQRSAEVFSQTVRKKSFFPHFRQRLFFVFFLAGL